MAAAVSSLVQMLGGCKEEGERKRELVTMDLLGGGGAVEERPATVVWDRRLDFLSGRTYGQRSGSGSAGRQLQDLNLPPPSSAASEDFAALELQLVAPSATAAEYRSVCTLEKVKSALERAERESRGKQRTAEGYSLSPSSTTTTTASAKCWVGGKESADEMESSDGGGGGGMVAAGCPRCLLYVLISKSDPRCPRCDSQVPVPASKKRLRIDLNSAHG